MRSIDEVARGLGGTPWGPGAWKLALDACARPRRGRLVLVTSATPTSHGEGKTVTTIGLADALAAAGTRAAVCIRQPSLSPLLGAKGGGSGGGRARLMPQAFVDVHFTGDLHAVAASQNLVAAMLDNHLHHGDALGIDVSRPVFPRCVDVNDRALRRVVTGVGAPANGPPREAGFVLAAASETMAVLALASSPRDLRERLGRMVVGFSGERAVRAAELEAAGPAAALLHDALRPNLVATAEGTPALVHAGPFANVSHGTSSVLATRAALAWADVVVQEAGFGADLGAEKYVDLVLAQGGAAPDLAVVVVSVRALREQGIENLDANVAIVRRLGIAPLVVLNRFPDDAPHDVDAIAARCASLGVPFAEHTAFADGAAGARDLAERVLASLAPSRAAPLYAPDAPFEEKLRVVATEVYGAEGVDVEPAAARDLDRLRRAGLGGLPVCVAKTPLSLSHDPARKGAPRGWRLPVKEVRVAAGAGYLVVIAGETQLMPGMSARPGALGFGLTDEGALVYPA